MVANCWVCRKDDPHCGEALLRPLLTNLKRRRVVQDCPTSCQELQSRSDQVWVRFYLPACGHHCAYHIDHRCCECRARDCEKSSASPKTNA